MPLNVADTDFDSIKQNLIDYLRSQNEFKDYDYAGSAMNIILDVLAYSTHYMSVHANMNINEMFLDTAKLRSSVVSKAKELGYTPKQYTGSTATINITADLTGLSQPAQVTVSKGTRYTGTNEDGTTFNFLANDDYILSSIGASQFSGDVDIVEGTNVSESWTYDVNNPEKFVLLNDSIDVNTLVVGVRDFLGSTHVIPKILSSNLVVLNQTSEAYFLQETSDGNVEIYFGDGNLGKTLVNGNIVEISYSTSKGSISNNISAFTLISDIGAYSKNKFSNVTLVSAQGGADRESIESIKHVAPKSYQAQNRCVTKDDYKAILLRENSNIKSANVWGGETETPPRYGRFFISVRTIDDSELSPKKKTAILDNIRQYNVLTVSPEIVDPEQLYIDINSIVTYRANDTSLSSGEINTLVSNTINTLFTTKLYDFTETFIHSELTGAIDDTDASIIGNLTDIKLTQKIIATAGARTVTYTYSNPVTAGSFTSTEWTDNDTKVKSLKDISGVIYETVNGVMTEKGVGTINYDNGDIVINDYNFNVSNIPIDFTVTPIDFNVTTNFNVLLNEGNTTVSVTRG